MRAEIQQRRYSERTLRQVRLDCGRALARERYCLESSEVTQFRCVDDQLETDSSFGHQLWYFEGVGVDESNHRQTIYGVLEYSQQFGLSELVEDRVFDSSQERERFRNVYHRETARPSWRQPAHRLLAAAMIAVAAATLMMVMARALMA